MKQAEAPAKVGVAPDYLSRSCIRTSAAGPVREGAVRQGGTVALARSSVGLYAYVADREERALHVVDVGARSSRTIRVEGAPEQLQVLADGRVVVTVGDARRVEVYEPTEDAKTPLAKLCEREVPAGPFGIASSSDDATVVVTSTSAPALTVLDATDLTVKSVRALPRSPRGVLVDAAGGVFVTHLAGTQVTVQDLEGKEPPKSISLALRAASPRAGTPADLEVDRFAGQVYALAAVTMKGEGTGGGEAPPLRGPKPTAPAAKPQSRTSVASRIIVPMVSIDPGDERRQGSLYYGPPPTLGVAKHAPVGVVIDPIARRSLSSHVIAASWDLLSRECTLPRAIAIDDERARAFVACMGTDVVHVVDATAADPMGAVLGRFEAPAGPSGVALDAKGETLVVWGEIASRVRVTRISDGRATDIDVESASSAEHRRGRELFYAADDRGISFDGLACASCHPDGNDDGLTWTTPEGPRQTPMLAGRLIGTSPYGWDRGSPTLEAYASETITRLRGQGLSEADLHSLARYIEAIPAPPARAAGEHSASGREIFFATGCGTCHTDGTGTDRELHRLERSDNVDTPSLKSVSMTAPYFHDGRYRTLDALLVHSEMGSMQKLDTERKAQLLEYLESL
ncbi:MAG: hypothetical protein HOV80_13270 [Polyangiaceae bacterium]|nr:hypothetical protein [Polyangiaceae bacterium]